MQEQLTFPELQLSATQLDTLEKVAATSTESDATRLPTVTEESAPEQAERISPPVAIARKTPRRRPAPPEMTLIPPPAAAPALSPVPPGARRRAPLTSPETGPATARAAIQPSSPDSASQPPIPAAAPTLPASQPPRPSLEQAVAANEQFRAPQPRPIQQPPATPAPRAAAADLQGSRLKTWAHLATILASLVAVAALVVGTSQFVETQEAQRASIALQNATLNQERIDRGDNAAEPGADMRHGPGFDAEFFAHKLKGMRERRS